MLKYPDDRFDGYVVLVDGNGDMFVPDFVKNYEPDTDAGNAIRYCRAFLTLAARHNAGPFSF